MVSLSSFRLITDGGPILGQETNSLTYRSLNKQAGASQTITVYFMTRLSLDQE
jgi:hypothetical protein